MAIWVWLKDPENRAVLAMLGSALLSLWTIGWGVWVYKYPPGSHQPAHGSKPLTNYSLKNLGGPIRIWILGIVVGLATWFVWEHYIADETVPAQYTVCTGEYERNCGFTHDVYLYCNADLNAWAKNQGCIKTSIAALGSHDGNKCGYGQYSISCLKKVSR